MTVVQITVTITPKLTNDATNPVNIVKGVTQQFTATALPDAAPQTFTWTLTCDGGGTTCGTIDAGTGLFTAPNAVPSTPTGQISATSTINPTGVDTVHILIVNPGWPQHVRLFSGLIWQRSHRRGGLRHR